MAGAELTRASAREGVSMTRSEDQSWPDGDLAERAVNAIRFLSIDMVEAAGCGHPGAPMGMAGLAYVLWTRHLSHDPSDPTWLDRDRFILSNGHASALLYALLYLTGYDLALDELKRFRQWGSLTPGHPEVHLTPGVETTTGPLGQGFANGVGMAIAESWLSARYNAGDHRIVDHHVYATVSDGDLQEGVASEAASLAGTLGLGKLIYLYDDNGIQIEGSTDVVFREDVAARFRAYGWQVIGPIEGNDLEAVDRAIIDAKTDADRPSLIVCRTEIGFGSPNLAGSAATHGAALGADEVKATREKLGWTHAPFVVPEDVRAHMREGRAVGRQRHAAWSERLAAARAEDPARVKEFESLMAGTLPDGWDAPLEGIFPDAAKMATRKASGKILNALSTTLVNLLGGSADLGPSNNTDLASSGSFGVEDRTGCNLHFGVREHAMGAIASGLSLHGGVIPYTGTFLTFSDYMRPSMRLAALMETRAIYVFTHDSIGLGEDGPTHQPIEHVAALRAIPNLTVVRPADAAECVEAWRAAVTHTGGPTALVFTRQGVPAIDRTRFAGAEGLARGAYVLHEDPDADATLIGTGSELHLCCEAADLLAADGVRTRIISMPSWELFEKQPDAYRRSVLGEAPLPTLAVEAGIAQGWHRWIGPRGEVLSVERFGASAPAGELFDQFGFTATNVAARVRRLIGAA